MNTSTTCPQNPYQQTNSTEEEKQLLISNRESLTLYLRNLLHPNKKHNSQLTTHNSQQKSQCNPTHPFTKITKKALAWETNTHVSQGSYAREWNKGWLCRSTLASAYWQGLNVENNTRLGLFRSSIHSHPTWLSVNKEKKKKKIGFRIDNLIMSAGIPISEVRHDGNMNMYTPCILLRTYHTQALTNYLSSSRSHKFKSTQLKNESHKTKDTKKKEKNTKVNPTPYKIPLKTLTCTTPKTGQTAIPILRPLRKLSPSPISHVSVLSWHPRTTCFYSLWPLAPLAPGWILFWYFGTKLGSHDSWKATMVCGLWGSEHKAPGNHCLFFFLFIS